MPAATEIRAASYKTLIDAVQAVPKPTNLNANADYVICVSQQPPAFTLIDYSNPCHVLTLSIARTMIPLCRAAFRHIKLASVHPRSTASPQECFSLAVLRQAAITTEPFPHLPQILEELNTKLIIPGNNPLIPHGRTGA